jgi:hypothetical protein
MVVFSSTTLKKMLVKLFDFTDWRLPVSLLRGVSLLLLRRVSLLYVNCVPVMKHVAMCVRSTVPGDGFVCTQIASRPTRRMHAVRSVTWAVVVGMLMMSYRTSLIVVRLVSKRYAA